MAARKPVPQRVAQAVSWTSDDGDTVELPPGVTPAQDAAHTPTTSAANGTHTDDPEPETAADRVVEMIIKNRERERSKIKVWKVLDTGELAFCNDYQPEVFEAQNLNLIRRQFGAGKYRIEIYAHNPIHKRFSCFGRETVNIVEVQESSDPEDIAERVAQRMGLGAAAATQPVTQMAQLKELLQLATLIREALGLNVAPPPPPPPQPSMAQQLGELLTIMKGAREVAAEIDPPPETADPLMKIAEQALPIIGRAIENQARPALAPVQLPPTLASAPANPTQQEDAAVTDKEFAALREAIRGINTLAFMDANVELAANLIFDKLPDEAFPILEAPEWFAKLCEIEPGCSKHQAWYQKVRDMLVKFWQEESVEDPPPAADVEPKAA
jgi:hypothetical protein